MPAEIPSADGPQRLIDRTAFHVYKLGQLIFQGAEEQLSGLSLNARTYFILAGVESGTGQVSQQDLSRMFDIDPTTIVGLVDELERAGFLERRRSAQDRRRYDLHLTSAGARSLADAHQIMEKIEADFLSPLPPSELRRYQALSKKVLDRHWPPSSGRS